MEPIRKTKNGKIRNNVKFKKIREVTAPKRQDQLKHLPDGSAKNLVVSKALIPQL